MIDLIQLKLDGWMSYFKKTIPLNTEGFVYIKGPIGAGKSAIPEAIFYLLFGKTLRKKDSVNSLVNRVLNKGYDNTLTLRIDGVEYTIQEIRGRPNNGVYFYKGKKDKRGKTDPETRKKIIKTLGVSADDFRSVAFLGQRQTQLLVEGTEEDRAKAIVSIFGLQRYNDLIKESNDRLKETNQEKKTLIDKLARYQEEFEALESSVKDEIEEEPPDEEDVQELKTKISKAEDKLEKIRKTATKLNAIIKTAETLEKQRKQAKKLRKEIKDIEEQLDEVELPEESKEKLRKYVTDLQNTQADLRTKINNAKQELEDVEEFENQCPITDEECPVNVPKKFKKERVTKFTKIKEGATAQLQLVKNNLSNRRCALEIIDEANELKTDIESKKNTVNSLTLNCPIEDVTEQQEELRKCKKGIIKGRDYIEGLIIERTDVISKIALTKQRKELLATLHDTLKEKKQAIKKLKETIEKKSIEAQYLAGAVAVFKKAKIYKIDLVIQLLNSNLKEILDKISDGVYKAEFTSQKETAKGDKILDKIGITVYDSYKSIPIELCSGGQSTEVGLAILLSTWKAANTISNKGVSSLWLDEVFGPLDEDIINRVFDSVLEVANEIGAKSVKIISHRDLDERLFDEVWDTELIDGITQLEIS